MTGESWSETIARPMVVGSSSSADGSGASVGLFYVFFILLMQVVLTNVVVAVRPVAISDQCTLTALVCALLQVLLEKMVEDRFEDDLYGLPPPQLAHSSTIPLPQLSARLQPQHPQNQQTHPDTVAQTPALQLSDHLHDHEHEPSTPNEPPHTLEHTPHAFPSAGAVVSIGIGGAGHDGVVEDSRSHSGQRPPLAVQRIQSLPEMVNRPSDARCDARTSGANGARCDARTSGGNGAAAIVALQGAQHARTATPRGRVDREVGALRAEVAVMHKRLVNVEGSVTHIDSTLQSLARDFQRMMAALDVPPDGRGGSGAAANAANSLMSV